MKTRILTALGLVGVFFPIYFFLSAKVFYFFSLLLGYGLYVESYRITYGRQQSLFWGGLPILIQVPLIGLFAIYCKNTHIEHSIVLLSSLHFMICFAVLSWLLRVFSMFLKAPIFNSRQLYWCQMLDITLFVQGLRLAYGIDRMFVFNILVIIVGIDSFGYFVGRYWGNTRIFPKISPNKTFEGYIGGLVWVGLYGSIILIPKEMSILTLTLFLHMVYILAITGDLLVSYQKRLLDVKDSGTLLPGHGGLLDRFDSWIFVLAFVYYLMVIN
jgi:phosphatidate cytidylyltransferase